MDDTCVVINVLIVYLREERTQVVSFNKQYSCVTKSAAQHWVLLRLTELTE